MSRPPRLEFDGALYHLMARGNRRQRIFRDDLDRTAFLARLQRVVGRSDAELYAFVLMPNHVHLVLRRRHTPAGRVMHGLLSPYARYFNLRHEVVGHVFQGRYRALVCEDETYFLRLVRYVHHNPVEAGLSKTPLYEWSSYPMYLRRGDTAWLETRHVLSCFGDHEDDALAAFRDFHEGEKAPGESDDIFERGETGVLGDEGFAERARRRAAVSRPQRDAWRKPLDEILEEALAATGHRVDAIEVRGPSRRRVAIVARLALVELAVERYGWSYAELGGYLLRAPNTLRALLSRHRRRV